MEEEVRKKVEEVLEGTGGKLEDNDVIRFDPMVPTKVVNDVAVKIDSMGIIIEGIKRIGEEVLMFLKMTNAPNSWTTITPQEIIDAVKIGGR